MHIGFHSLGTLYLDSKCHSLSCIFLSSHGAHSYNDGYLVEQQWLSNTLHLENYCIHQIFFYFIEFLQVWLIPIKFSLRWNFFRNQFLFLVILSLEMSQLTNCNRPKNPSISFLLFFDVAFHDSLNLKRSANALQVVLSFRCIRHKKG